MIAKFANCLQAKRDGDGRTVSSGVEAAIPYLTVTPLSVILTGKLRAVKHPQGAVVCQQNIAIVLTVWTLES